MLEIYTTVIVLTIQGGRESTIVKKNFKLFHTKSQRQNLAHVICGRLFYHPFEIFQYTLVEWSQPNTSAVKKRKIDRT